MFSLFTFTPARFFVNVYNIFVDFSLSLSLARSSIFFLFSPYYYTIFSPLTFASISGMHNTHKKLVKTSTKLFVKLVSSSASSHDLQLAQLTDGRSCHQDPDLFIFSLSLCLVFEN